MSMSSAYQYAPQFQNTPSRHQSTQSAQSARFSQSSQSHPYQKATPIKPQPASFDNDQDQDEAKNNRYDSRHDSRHGSRYDTLSEHDTTLKNQSFSNFGTPLRHLSSKIHSPLPQATATSPISDQTQTQTNEGIDKFDSTGYSSLSNYRVSSPYSQKNTRSSSSASRGVGDAVSSDYSSTLSPNGTRLLSSLSPRKDHLRTPSKRSQQQANHNRYDLYTNNVSNLVYSSPVNVVVADLSDNDNDHDGSGEMQMQMADTTGNQHSFNDTASVRAVLDVHDNGKNVTLTLRSQDETYTPKYNRSLKSESMNQPQSHSQLQPQSQYAQSHQTPQKQWDSTRDFRTPQKTSRTRQQQPQQPQQSQQSQLPQQRQAPPMAPRSRSVFEANESSGNYASTNVQTLRSEIKHLLGMLTDLDTTLQTKVDPNENDVDIDLNSQAHLKSPQQQQQQQQPQSREFQSAPNAYIHDNDIENGGDIVNQTQISQNLSYQSIPTQIEEPTMVYNELFTPRKQKTVKNMINSTNLTSPLHKNVFQNSHNLQNMQTMQNTQRGSQLQAQPQPQSQLQFNTTQLNKSSSYTPFQQPQHYQQHSQSQYAQPLQQQQQQQQQYQQQYQQQQQPSLFATNSPASGYYQTPKQSRQRHHDRDRSDTSLRLEQLDAVTSSQSQEFDLQKAEDELLHKLAGLHASADKTIILRESKIWDELYARCLERLQKCIQQGELYAKDSTYYREQRQERGNNMDDYDEFAAFGRYDQDGTQSTMQFDQLYQTQHQQQQQQQHQRQQQRQLYKDTLDTTTTYSNKNLLKDEQHQMRLRQMEKLENYAKLCKRIARKLRHDYVESYRMTY